MPLCHSHQCSVSCMTACTTCMCVLHDCVLQAWVTVFYIPMCPSCRLSPMPRCPAHLCDLYECMACMPMCPSCLCVLHKCVFSIPVAKRPAVLACLLVMDTCLSCIPACPSRLCILHALVFSILLHPACMSPASLCPESLCVLHARASFMSECPHAIFSCTLDCPSWLCILHACFPYTLVSCTHSCPTCPCVLHACVLRASLTYMPLPPAYLCVLHAFLSCMSVCPIRQHSFLQCHVCLWPVWNSKQPKKHCKVGDSEMRQCTQVDIHCKEDTACRYSAREKNFSQKILN